MARTLAIVLSVLGNVANDMTILLSAPDDGGIDPPPGGDAI
jgi:hypothetical protein